MVVVMILLTRDGDDGGDDNRSRLETTSVAPTVEQVKFLVLYPNTEWKICGTEGTGELIY